MSSCKKSRGLEAFPRTRKRNSISNKSVSHGAHNVARSRVSLLKNNKTLAISLQETRCELSAYKSFFEESLEYVTKAKLARSKMAQLSAVFKNFIKDFDEHLLLLEFDDSKWPNIKNSGNSCKIFQNDMNPVFEETGEILEEAPTDQHVENQEERSDPIIETAPCNPTVVIASEDQVDPESARELLRKETDNFAPDTMEMNSNCEVGKKDARKEVSPDSSSLPPAYVPWAPIKVTKIPVCQNFSTKLKKQKTLKRFKALDKAYKQKWPVNMDKVSDLCSRRKTFVVKCHNASTHSESTESTMEENKLLSDKNSVSKDESIPKTDKRKTFVIKNDKTKPAAEVPFHQNGDSEFQPELLNRRFTCVIKKLPTTEESQQSENMRPDIRSNSLEMDDGAIKMNGVFAENPEHSDNSANVASVEKNITPSTEKTANDRISASCGSTDMGGTEEMSEEILKPKLDNAVDPIAAKDADQNDDIKSTEVAFSDDSPKSENVVSEACNFSPMKTRRSFLESSDSEVVLIDEIEVDEPRSVLKKTPIRRQISKTKKKKFIFDGNRRKSILKNKSLGENGNSNIDSKKITHEVHLISDDEVVDNYNPKTVEHDVLSVRKKSKKIKSGTSVKSAAEKKSNKPQKVKNKRNPSRDSEADFIPPKKKTKKKKENAYFDETVSKYVEGKKVTKSRESEGTDKEVESDFPCKMTGKNTFLVKAEIHPPPPTSETFDIKKLNKENKKADFPHMELTVVLDDIFKSKQYEFLNKADRDLICSRDNSVKSSASNSVCNVAVDPDESIERLCSDPAPDVNDFDLNCDAVLDMGHCDQQSDLVSDTENPRPRRRKDVNYKEPSLIRKMRRC